MQHIGEGIGLAGLAIAAAWLEINGKPAGVLWAVVILWAFFFGPSEKKG